MLVALALFAQLQATAPAGPPLSERDSIGALSRARIAASTFVATWRYYWESSEALRYGYTTSWPAPRGVAPVSVSETDARRILRIYGGVLAPQPLRLGLLHCHPVATVSVDRTPPPAPPRIDAGGGTLDPPGSVFPTGSPILAARGGPPDAFARISTYIIDNPTNYRAICPSWYPARHDVPWDERFGIDASIIPDVLPFVKKARAVLLTQLDSVGRLLPGDNWVVGQRVRFALDQADTVRAQNDVRDCRAARWWCTALSAYLTSGYVTRIPGSDSLFNAALATMPREDHCEWNDLQSLLDSLGRVAYSKFDCAARDSVNTRIWWLADPVYIEKGNERRVEHYARVMLVRLRMGTDFNERWDMNPGTGGAPVQEMLLRYGWPSVSWWGGQTVDLSHYSYLGYGGPADEDILAHGRFATAEYSRARFSTVSAWSAIVDPFGASGDEWVLSQSAEGTINPADTLWWPREHFDRKGSPLVQLWHQAAMFRRDTAVYFATASYLFPSEFNDAAGDTLRGMLIFSPAPEVLQVTPRGGIVGRSFVAKALIASRPQIVALELAGHHPDVVARDRFGIVPPPVLAGMKPGEIGISQPALIQPPDPGTPFPSSFDGILNRMYGNTAFKPTKLISLYWETYGVADGDTVELSVKLERHVAPPGALRRVGFKLGIGQRQDGGISVGWREPSRDHTIIPIPGKVPAQGRTVTLDISQIVPGDYSFVVTAKRPGGTAVTESRDFWIVNK